MYLFHNGEIQIAYIHNIKLLGPKNKTRKYNWKTELESRTGRQLDYNALWKTSRKQKSSDISARA